MLVHFPEDPSFHLWSLYVLLRNVDLRLAVFPLLHSSVTDPKLVEGAVRNIREALARDSSRGLPAYLGVATRLNLGIVPGALPVETAIASDLAGARGIEALDVASSLPSGPAATSRPGGVHVLALSTRHAAYVFHLGLLVLRTGERRAGPSASPSLPKALVDLLVDPAVLKVARHISGHHPLFAVGRQHAMMYRLGFPLF